MSFWPSLQNHVCRYFKNMSVNYVDLVFVCRYFEMKKSVRLDLCNWHHVISFSPSVFISPNRLLHHVPSLFSCPNVEAVLQVEWTPPIKKCSATINKSMVYIYGFSCYYMAVLDVDSYVSGLQCLCYSIAYIILYC